MNEIPFVDGDRSDRQAVATTQHEKVPQWAFGMLTQRLQCDGLRKPGEQLNLDLVPARIGVITRRIVVSET